MTNWHNSMYSKCEFQHTNTKAHWKKEKNWNGKQLTHNKTMKINWYFWPDITFARKQRIALKQQKKHAKSRMNAKVICSYGSIDKMH